MRVSEQYVRMRYQYGSVCEPPPLPDGWKECDPGWERMRIEFSGETVTIYWGLFLPPVNQ